MKKALITFVKAPVPGTVKTRLQGDLETDKITEIYKAFITEIVSQCARLKGTDRFLGCAPSKDHVFLKETAGKFKLKSFNQRGADLGEKIVNAFRDYFKKEYSGIVLIGSDSPTIPVSYIKKAFTALERHDFVLGPCCDGGLYLIGARNKIIPDIFRDIPWDSSMVLNKTLDNIAHLDIKLFLLPFWYDVDTIDGLTFLKNHLRHLNRKPFFPSF
jgi:rSAM/selenodomain-associated transferase 1